MCKHGNILYKKRNANIMRNKKSLFCLVFFCFLLLVNIQKSYYVFANSSEYLESYSPYIVYDENDDVLAERYFVEEGDKIITSDLNEYEIYFVDYSSKIAFAKNTGYYLEPKIIKEDEGLRLASPIKKSVGLYMTHNDESFTPTDGYSSVYGKGGIHDVAKRLKQEFEDLGYEVFFDETLHLPHDSKAYSRSESTAKNLLNKNVDALFDIHRDGVSRSVYVKNVDGVERCKVRIVVGQANPNKEVNLQFAMFLVNVAKEYCPWLFLDIYYAKGHYNQELTSKGLLFEMGTYLAEKDLVLDSTPYLAQVVDKTLFSTVVEDDETLVVKDEETAVIEENNVNNLLQAYNEEQKVESEKSKKLNSTVLWIFICLVGTVLYLFVLGRKKKVAKG